jgi:hypothetical protein
MFCDKTSDTTNSIQPQFTRWDFSRIIHSCFNKSMLLFYLRNATYPFFRKSLVTIYSGAPATMPIPSRQEPTPAIMFFGNPGTSRYDCSESIRDLRADGHTQPEYLRCQSSERLQEGDSSVTCSRSELQPSRLYTASSRHSSSRCYLRMEDYSRDRIPLYIRRAQQHSSRA